MNAEQIVMQSMPFSENNYYSSALPRNWYAVLNPDETCCKISVVRPDGTDRDIFYGNNWHPDRNAFLSSGAANRHDQMIYRISQGLGGLLP